MRTTAPGTKRIGLTGPVVLITLGLLFLAVNFNFVEDIARLWPVALIAGGVALMFDRFRN